MPVTKDEIRQRILNVINELGIDYMPTRKEMYEVDSPLTTIIGRNGGFGYWREELNLKEKPKIKPWTTERIEKEIFESMNDLNIQRMPTGNELYEINRGGLANAIARNGGYKKWRIKLGLDGIRGTESDVYWTEDKIKKGIYEVISYHSLDRMPLLSECIDYPNNGKGLGHAITRYGGFEGWAKKLGLPRGEGSTHFGQKGESMALELIHEKGYEAKRLSTIAPYDILVNDSIKIDVKSARLNTKSGKGSYMFSTEDSMYHKCDIYICLGFDENGNNLHYTYIIPSCQVVDRKVHIDPKTSTNYGLYRDKWEYIDKFNNFYKIIKGE